MFLEWSTRDSVFFIIFSSQTLDVAFVELFDSHWRYGDAGDGGGVAVVGEGMNRIRPGRMRVDP